MEKEQSDSLEQQIQSRRLTEGEMLALEYYATHQRHMIPGSLAALYMLRAIRELRAIRRAGVLVNPDPDPAPAPIDHLPGCVTSHEDSIKQPVERWCAEGCPVNALIEERHAKASAENCPQDGQWTASTDEEHWNGREGFDTEAEAIEAGKVLCEEYNVEDGMSYFTGVVERCAAPDFANAIHGSDLVESIEIYFYDNHGEYAEDGIHASTEDEQDLERRVCQVVIDWANDRKIVPAWYTVERVKIHTFHVCKVEDTSRRDPNNHPKCTRHEGHDGDHEYE